jgi:hypothetical protein
VPTAFPIARVLASGSASFISFTMSWRCSARRKWRNLAARVLLFVPDAPHGGAEVNETGNNGLASHPGRDRGLARRRAEAARRQKRTEHSGELTIQDLAQGALFGNAPFRFVWRYAFCRQAAEQ